MINDIFDKILDDKALSPQHDIESNLDAIHAWYPECEAYDPQGYARHIVRDKDELNQVILACWQKGQMTPIHDHPKQSCWIYMLKGNIQETFIPLAVLQNLNLEDQFLEQPSWLACMQEHEFSKQQIKYAQTHIQTRNLTPGEWHYIDDSFGVHQMMALSEQVSSLHFYRSL